MMNEARKGVEDNISDQGRGDDSSGTHAVCTNASVGAKTTDSE